MTEQRTLASIALLESSPRSRAGIAVGHDPATNGPFDHVVVTCAERLSAETLDGLRKLARRVVLIGSRFGRQAGPLFGQLYAERDAGPWVAESGRLTVRVVPVPSNRRNDLRCEPLADRPEIELRFLGDDLAEVAFPDATSRPRPGPGWRPSWASSASPCGRATGTTAPAGVLAPGRHRPRTGEGVGRPGRRGESPRRGHRGGRERLSPANYPTPIAPSHSTIAAILILAREIIRARSRIMIRRFA